VTIISSIDNIGNCKRKREPQDQTYAVKGSFLLSIESVGQAGTQAFTGDRHSILSR
jgi:hypothetical protein